MSPKVVAVVLNTNRRVDTLGCLASLAGGTYSNLEVIVLDNHSNDGSIEAIRVKFPAVLVHPLTQNLGYAGNNNVGVDLALQRAADWVLILNEDTVLAADCVDRLVQAAESRARVGMAGPMIYHYDEKNIIQSAGGRLDRYWTALHIGQDQLDTGQYVEPRCADWLSGCALMVRRSLIEQLGALDERLFIYWEEIDWCLRARRHGWDLLQVPQARLWHKGGQRNHRPRPSVTYYSVRNQFLVLAKHQAPWKVWVHRWTQALRTYASWSLRPKWRHMREHRDALGQAVRDYVFGRWGMRVT